MRRKEANLQAIDEVIEFRRQKDEFFRHQPQSPLPHEERHQFQGLHYFEPNPNLTFTLEMEEADGSTIEVATSDGQTRRYIRAGRVRFDVAGQGAELTLFGSPGHPGFFLPFRDATSGAETYGAGRYLDLEPNADGTITIDFNYAYNPSCVYSEDYSCPLPPPENWLKVPIRAGEKSYH